jgi:hypothetical protein
MHTPPEALAADQCWALVAQFDGNANTLRRLLMGLSRDEIVAFDKRMYDVLCRLDRRDIHDMTDGSDDGFLYRRLWIVSRGRDYFESVLRDPENAPHFADAEENEEFMYAAIEAYEEKFGEPLPDYPERPSRAVNVTAWERE